MLERAAHRRTCLNIVISAARAEVLVALAATLRSMAARNRSAIGNGLVEYDVAVVAVLVVLASLLIWKAILPGWRVLNTDFPNYYVVARLLREGYSLDRIYDWIWLQRIRDHWGIGGNGLVGFAGLTPFSCWPVVPLTYFTALTAKRVQIVLNIVFLGASSEFLHRSTTLNRKNVWLITLLAFTPLRTSFLYGQMHILVLLLLVLAYFFAQRHRSIACGACIAIAGALKIYPLLFVLYFAWKKQYRLALSTLAAAFVVIMAGMFSFGPHLLHTYVTQILPSTLQAEAIDPYNIRAASAASLLHHLFLYEPGLNPKPVYASPGAYAVFYPLFQLAIFLPLFALLRPRSTPTREKLEWAAFLLALLVASPVPASYHFVVMIPCMTLLADFLQWRGNRSALIAAFALYVLISPASSIMPSNLPALPFILFSTARLWIGVALLGLFFGILARHHSSAHSSLLRTTLLFAASAAVLTASIVHWHRHLTSMNEQIAQRLSVSASILLATSPVPLADGGYLYVAMTRAGYQIFDQNGRIVFTDPGPTARDQLSFTVTPSGVLLIELADATGSNIALLSPDSHGRIILRDAESPAISSDGRTIAFVRERRGLGSIWTAHFDGASASEPIQATPDSYHVRNVAFGQSAELLFTASTSDTHGRSGLYTSSSGGPPRQISASVEEIGPASSARFTRLIALTHLEHNRQQLFYLDPTSGHETALTAQDCNAYAPAWATADTLLYTTDCARGYGLTALAIARLSGR